MQPSDINPYASTAETASPAAEVPRTSPWRAVVMLLSLLISVALLMMACYGVFSLHSRGWPHAPGQTIVILAALGMFVVAAAGLGAIGVGVLRHREPMAWAGLIAIILATIVYFLLFLIAN